MEEDEHDELARLLQSRANPKSPAFLELRSSKGFIVFVVSLGVFTVSSTRDGSLLHFPRRPEG